MKKITTIILLTTMFLLVFTNKTNAATKSPQPNYEYSENTYETMCDIDMSTSCYINYETKNNKIYLSAWVYNCEGENYHDFFILNKKSKDYVSTDKRIKLTINNNNTINITDDCSLYYGTYYRMSNYIKENNAKNFFRNINNKSDKSFTAKAEVIAFFNLENNEECAAYCIYSNNVSIYLLDYNYRSDIMVGDYIILHANIAGMKRIGVDNYYVLNETYSTIVE